MLGREEERQEKSLLRKGREDKLKTGHEVDSAKANKASANSNSIRIKHHTFSFLTTLHAQLSKRKAKREEERLWYLGTLPDQSH